MMMRCGAVSSSPLIDNSLDDVLEENIKSCRFDVGACRQYPVNDSLYYYYDRAYPRMKQETCNFRRVTLDRVTNDMGIIQPIQIGIECFWKQNLNCLP